MDKQIVVYPYSGILLSHKKEQNTDTYYNMDELWKHAKEKGLVTKGHMLHDSVYMKYSE